MAQAAHALTRRATPPSLVRVRVGIWVCSLSTLPRRWRRRVVRGSAGLPLVSERLSPQAAGHPAPHLLITFGASRPFD